MSSNINQKAEEILKSDKVKLDKVAGQLIKKETLEAEEFEKIMGKSKKTPVSLTSS